MSRKKISSCAALVLISAITAVPTTSEARLLVTNSLIDSVEIFDETNLTPTGTLVAPFEFGVAVSSNIILSPDGNSMFVSFNLSQNIMVYDSTTGARLPAPAAPGGDGLYGVMTGGAPSGLAFGPGPANKLYVGDQSSNHVYVYDGTTTAPLGAETIVTPEGSMVGGLDFGPDGRLYITDFTPNGTVSVRVWDGVGTTTTSPFASVAAPGFGVGGAAGIEVDGDGNVYVAGLFDNSIIKFDSNGDSVPGLVGPGLPFIYIDTSLFPLGPTFFSNAPSDIILDNNGDLLIAFMGNTQSSPDGGILRYSSEGELLDYYYTGIWASSLVLQAEAESVPEPSTYALGLVGMMVLGFWGWKRRR